MNWFGRKGRRKGRVTSADKPIATLEPRRLRQAFGSFATGVTIVTTVDAAGCDVGITVNSLSSLSLDPPLLLWSLARSSSSYPAFQQARHFMVHVLDQSQAALSRQFSARGTDRFAGVPIERGADSCPMLLDYHARFECRLVRHHEGGDHLIVVGEILNISQKPGKPLLFYRGCLTQLHDAGEDAGHAATSAASG